MEPYAVSDDDDVFIMYSYNVNSKKFDTNGICNSKIEIKEYLKSDLSEFGLDPETADNNNGGYGNNQGYFFPITRVYNFGLNVQF